MGAVPWTNEVIETDRMTLRCPTDADMPTILRILRDEQVRRHLGGPVSMDVVQAVQARSIGEQGGLFVAELRDGGRPIGTFAIEEDRELPELSYQLLPEWWGTGLAFEASTALLRWAWREMEVPAIIAVTQEANLRSLSLLAKLGFQPDTQFEEYGELQAQMRLQRPLSLKPPPG